VHEARPDWAGAGSIGAYNAALGQARSNGIATISAADGQQVSAWGILRNGAAHGPTTFNATADEIKLALQGIRAFVARY
jgi:hypothetical protein